MKFILTSILILSVNAGGSLYDMKINSLDGKIINFEGYKGKTLLIVNTASECGHTPQYADLQKLHATYGSKVTILGFPANDFGGQEPGSNAQIASFCKKNYGVTFQMFEKISVTGKDQHALYGWLKEKTGNEPSWNFCKYLVKPDGTVKFFASNVNPMDKQITDEL
ncbi:MAG: glutathione peroxidase [Bacteroidota bacterium]